MNHLTTTEIIDFVSISKMDADSMKLASRVNGHILKCDECLKIVESFQEVYDELQRMGRSTKIEKIMAKNSSGIKSPGPKDICNTVSKLGRTRLALRKG